MTNREEVHDPENPSRKTHTEFTTLSVLDRRFVSLLPVALQTSSASSTPQRDWATQNFVPLPVTEKSNWMQELSLKVSVPQPSLHPGSRFRQCSAQTEPQLTQLDPNFPSNEVSYVARQCQPSVSSMHKSLSRAFPESTSRTTDINHSHRHPQTMACPRPNFASHWK